MKEKTIYDVQDEYPSYQEENKYAIDRIGRSKYLPIEMIINICRHKAMKRIGMVSMNWLMDLKRALEEIIEERRWYEGKSLPF